MASKSGQPAKAENPEELLELAEQTLDRLRVMYEQYFLGMQKQAPGVLHSEVERRVRDLQQANLRNTALRYRFATLQQKFASYNAYWRRTLRQIENGTYTRILSKLGRAAARSGADVPEEILAAMPKRMREQVQRDRAAALAAAARRGGKAAAGAAPEELLDLDEALELAEAADGAMTEAPLELSPEELADVVAMIKEPSELRRTVKQQRGPLTLDESDGDLDIDSFFAAVEADSAPADPAVSFRGVARGVASPSQQMVTQPVPVQRPSQPAPLAATPTPAAVQRPSQPAPLGATPTPRPAPLGATPTPMPIPAIPAVRPAPSQAVKPNPIAPGAAANARLPAPMPTQPMPRPPPPLGATPTPPPLGATPTPPPLASAPTPPARPTPVPGAAAPVATRPPVRRPRADTEPEPPRAAPPARPPPGMTDADVNALYAKYVKAKEMVGEDAGPGARAKLLKTIHAQAPKIMEQYKAKGVDFQVVVKDNQVIIRAKPKP